MGETIIRGLKNRRDRQTDCEKDSNTRKGKCRTLGHQARIVTS